MKCWFFGLAGLLSTTTFAATDLKVPLDNSAEATITVSSCFSVLPSSGYAPIAIAINNDSLRPRAWTFAFKSPAFAFALTNTMDFSVDLQVQSKSARTFNILVPLGFRSSEYYVSALGLTVDGPGASAVSNVQFPNANRTGKAATAFVAISESLAAKSESAIRTELASGKDDLFSATFVPNELPGDWRPFVGIDAIWITRSEVDALSSAQRGAVHDWLSRGGALFISGATEGAEPFQGVGFGTLTVVPDPPLDVSETVAAIRRLKATTMDEQLNKGYAANWNAVSAAGPIKLRASLLIGVMALFAVVAGPVNLFVFAGRLRRHRLFWTTPLISIAASVLLFVLIILQDGFGGSGVRTALIHISSAEKKQLVMQEQIARTGVLLGTSFTVPDPCFIGPIVLDARRTVAKRNYHNSGDTFGGEWFGSRSVQAHWIESIVPKRADIVLANPLETQQPDVAPVIVSSIAAPLERVYYRDANRQAWSARNVETGKKVTLQKELEIPNLLPPEAGPRLRTLWDRVHDQENCFYATSRDSSSLVATLPSIFWRNDHVIFVQPLSDLPPRL
jgi:hypothetical protein